jgi:hypothetical protein
MDPEGLLLNGGPSLVGGWFASFVPSMNFTAIVTLVISSLYLSGVFVSYSKCGNQGACSIMPEKFVIVTDDLSLSWTCICIVVSGLWLISRYKTFHQYLLDVSKESLFKMTGVYLPLVAVSLTLLVTAIIATTRIADDEVDLLTGLSKPQGGGGETCVLWILFGLWTASMFTQGKVESMIAEFRTKMNE